MCKHVYLRNPDTCLSSFEVDKIISMLPPSQEYQRGEAPSPIITTLFSRLATALIF